MSYCQYPACEAGGKKCPAKGFLGLTCDEDKVPEKEDD